VQKIGKKDECIQRLGAEKKTDVKYNLENLVVDGRMMV
jgi:hypothetical protein